MTKAESNSPYRLLVEGNDDKWSVLGLLQRHGYDSNAGAVMPWIEDARGVERLLKEIPTALKVHRRLGVVLDADEDPLGRWKSLCDRAYSVGIELPPSPTGRGVVVQSLLPGSRFGVWLMPDNRARGALEHFLALLVPEGDPCWGHAEEATAKARALRADLAEKDHMKGALHAWLAWQKIPGQPFGTALTTRTFRRDSEEALRFVEWFREVFEG